MIRVKWRTLSPSRRYRAWFSRGPLTLSRALALGAVAQRPSTSGVRVLVTFSVPGEDEILNHLADDDMGWLENWRYHHGQS